MEGEIVCRSGAICKVMEKKKQRGIFRKTISRIITCTGVGIILLLAVPIIISAVLIASVWWLTDKAVSFINKDRDIY